MADLLDGLTSTEAIRSALGIDAGGGELPDSEFDDLQIENLLELAIYSWLPVTISAVESASYAATSPYDKAAQAYRALKAYAQYYGAYLFVLSAPLGFAERIKDSNSELKRLVYKPQELLSMYEARWSRYKEACVENLELVSDTAAAPAAFFGSARPSYDPVTNLSS